MTTNYRRVIPRDLFNEASLLKCLGRFWIETERFQPKHVTIEHDGEAFDVWQDESDGNLSVRNVEFYINGTPHHLRRRLNSREPWPLELHDGEDYIPVFTDDGALTAEILALIKP
jgi:hypothetical protein